VDWGVISLVPLMVMYCVDKKRRKRKYSKNSAASVQNGDFYCKKWAFTLLLLTNPLSYTIRRIISMRLVAIGVLLSLPIGPQQLIIMVIFFLVKNDVMHTKITSISNFKPPSFLIHHGNHHLSCCYTPCMPFPFIPTLLVC
jgi:hypothetical protein